MIKEKEGMIFSIADENQPIPGCTVSREVYQQDNLSITYFSLDEETNISAESYGYPKLLILNEGNMELYSRNQNLLLNQPSQCVKTPMDIPIGINAKSKCVYTELVLRRNTVMNRAIKEGEIFSLAELVPYQEGKIVNMDLISDPTLKFVVMSFDAGTGLSEHAAPGEALIFALDGEGIIGYEGKEYPIRKGGNFKFAKNGMHYVKAEKPFKMALLLTLEK